MKKIMAIAIGILLCIALVVPLFAESQGIVPPTGMKVLLEDDFSDSLDTTKWSVRGGVKTSDGTMVLGEGGDWVAGGYSATAIGSFSNYVLDFDFTGDKRDCYYGVGIRAKASGGSEFQNGGRFGVPSAAELSTGISFDLFISKNENAENGAKNVGVALNNGGANGDAAQFLVAYPEGFDGSAGHVTIVDAGDTVTLLINNAELVTLKLGEGTVTAYDAAGEKLYEGSAAFPASGTFSFYQRNDLLKIDNVKVSSLYDRDFDSAKGDHLSYDQILVNGAQIANGNDAVIAAKKLIDGSDGSIENVAMHGWYGNDNYKIASYGYKIDGGDPVFGDFAVPAEDNVIAAGGESRYTVTVDVSKITDGRTHKIEVVVKLENGQIVTLNRNDNGTKDREVYVNYKSVAEPKTSLDYFKVNGEGENHNSTESGDAITINKGDTLKAVGWAYKYGTNLKRVYWQYVERDGKIKEGPIMDCSDVYRKREDVAQYFGYTAEEYVYFANSGFGKDDNFIELLGVSALEAGEYDVRFVAEFEDGTTSVIKKKFALTVVDAEPVPDPTVKVIVGETETAVKPDAKSGVVLSMDGDKLVATTDADAGDPWISIPLDNIDTNVYTSISVKYTVDPGMHGNNIYLRDTTVNPGYSGTAGTWCAPDMNARTEKTYFIVASFSTMAGTQLTGIRFPGATAGGTLTIESITFRTKDETEYTNFVDFDDVESYGMSFDYFFWNGGNLGGGRAVADLFVRPDAMPVEDYGGVATGYSGWVAFKQKVKAFGYIIDGKLVTNEAFYQSNENGLSALVDGWDGWKGSGETMQRFIIAVPFDGQSGAINVVAAAVLEDGTVVKLNSKAIHDRDTEINFIFNDVREHYGEPTTVDTGWWTNPFKKDSVTTINFTADSWFNGFETFIYASDEAQIVHVTVKDSDGNVIWEEDFKMNGNQKYTFYKNGAKFAPGDYTIEFDGRNMADDAGTWLVLGSTTPFDGKTATASGNYGSNNGYTGLYFTLIKTTPFVEYMSRDQVTVNGVDKAKFGGNDAVTTIEENLYSLTGEKLRIWGWYGNNMALDKYGVKVDGGEIQYFDRYEAQDIVNHFKANLIKDDDVFASRYEIFVDITEGQHTAEVFAIVNGEEHLIWTVNYSCIPEEAPAQAEVTAVVNDEGKLVVTVTGEFGDKDWIGIYAEGNTPGGSVGSLVWWYVGANGGTFEVPFEGMGENDRAALLNDDGTVKAGKFVVYLLANDGYDVVEGTEGIEVTVEEQAETQPTTEPETNTQTGEGALAIFAVIAVLAMGAAVVFMKKRAF